MKILSRFFIIGAAFLSVLGISACSGSETWTNPKADKIQIETPQAYETVESPLLVNGLARGTWYFEASFPVWLLDDQGNELAVTPAQAQGEWMTEDFVPFSAMLEFETSAKTGTLVLEKDNPSGLPEHADELRIPVKF